MESVRKLGYSDVDEIILLRMKLQQYDFKDVEKTHNLLMDDELTEITRVYLINNLDENLFLFGYFVDNKLVSNCGFIIEKHFPTYNNSSGSIAYICNVFTLEEYRGRGFQKKVFEFALNYAENIGLNKFELASKNEKAIKMYESFGFVRKNNYYEYKIKG